ncbi:hypothetical protein Poli38472_009400 [Pythium oligandrum]|uniref:Uncharacterized protein n=1 Tax=Pythium oligandrum TaxID=41045 RepID=A0A8K1FP34_PYTOL|nr:hypothetical protein Poli38472_009400 [Pythium oligandrum]|eukprot:TMW65233.1 hypothetical protein Poli38472_009400 [Pythium oligandrum]
MFARQTVRAARATRSISSLVNKPSEVSQSQKLFLNSHKPTYLKRDSDKAIFTGLLGLFGFGMVQFVRGEVCMATGKGKKE